MEDRIDISGLRTLVPNVCWGKGVSSRELILPGDKPVPVSQIYRTERVTYPSLDEVLNLLRDRAIEFCKNPKEQVEHEETVYIDGEGSIIYRFQSMSLTDVQALASEDKKMMQRFRNNYVKPDLPSGTEYIRTLSGVLPDSNLNAFLKQVQGKNITSQSDWIKGRVARNKWKYALKPQPDGTLPPLEKISSYLDQRLTDTDEFIILDQQGDYYDEVATHARAFYAAFQAGLRLELLENTSGNHLLSAANSILYHALESQGEVREIGEMQYDPVTNEPTVSINDSTGLNRLPDEGYGPHRSN